MGTDRNFEARLFAPINAGSFLIGYQPLDSIFRPENMDINKLYYVETTDKSDKYTASENLYASYLMFDIILCGGQHPQFLILLSIYNEKVSG